MIQHIEAPENYTPSIEEIRRQWGLATDIHHRPERLAQFDRAMAQLWQEAYEAGEVCYATALDPDHQCIKNPFNE